MATEKTTTLIGRQDQAIDAAGGTFSRTRVVDGVETTSTVDKVNASTYPLATADQNAVTNAGYSADDPSSFAAEMAPQLGKNVADAAALRAITYTPTAGQAVLVRDQNRWFFWDSSSTASDDGTTIIKVTAITTGRFLAETAATADSVNLAVLPYPFAEFHAIGDLNAMVGSYLGYVMLPKAGTLSYVTAFCPSTAASGTIEFDILKSDSDGDAFASLYSVAALPTITCDGTNQRTSQSGGTLPDTTSLPAGTVVGVKLTSAPVGCTDLIVQLY